ncbi:DUF4352 domain-containing protein [Clostridium ganghwense]|uniref:DUF4352 domain-containing protein n=1 Tax=Clostridium ganghwense TaxID=312089 RepID=A0ABT4CLL2_9CLOT|nr:DUF4352 domain-containing protein [Clostridium ganghwense]MCY6369923.1 DUF4352 domain-containing protein [Clostridium ganghwense]
MKKGMLNKILSNINENIVAITLAGVLTFGIFIAGEMSKKLTKKSSENKAIAVVSTSNRGIDLEEDTKIENDSEKDNIQQITLQSNTLQNTATAFEGKLKLTKLNIKSSGDKLIVKTLIENNFDKEITISPYDIYVRGENGRVFKLDVFDYLEKGKDFEFVPGEKVEAELVFNNYKDSSTLNLNVTNIFCYGHFNEETLSLKLK